MQEMTAGERTKREILEMGVRLWRVDPSYVTARRIASELQMTHGAVQYHFPGGALRNAIAYHAVEQGDAKVIAQLILSKHKAVAHFDDAQRLDCMRTASAY
jgi:AcrR family transcriptional regulator